MCRIWTCGGLFDDVWQACQKVIQRHSAGPPLFSRLVSLVEVSVMADKVVDFVRGGSTMVTSLVQDLVAAADAFQLSGVFIKLPALSLLCIVT